MKGFSAVGLVILMISINLSRIESASNVTSEIMDRGELLVQIGKKMKDPVLELTGEILQSLAEKIASKEEDLEKMVVEKVHKEMEDQMKEKIQSEMDKLEEKQSLLLTAICDLHTCTAWSDWSPCVQLEGQLDDHHKKLGVTNRTRECGKNSGPCADLWNITAGEKQTETKVCIACPDHYDTTTTGFCVKLYSDDRKSWTDAEAQCKADGGHLLHIDSAHKFKDIYEYLRYKHLSRVWIDGIQLDSSSDWMFQDGPLKSGYTNWQSGQPNESKYPNCLYLLDERTRLWADMSCTVKYDYMCEVMTS